MKAPVLLTPSFVLVLSLLSQASHAILLELVFFWGTQEHTTINATSRQGISHLFPSSAKLSS